MATRGALLPRLTSLRIFAAAVVVLFHLGAWHVATVPGAQIGYVGVSFFFVLSGVVLAWGTRPDLPARAFYRRRFARVWPSHAVMLVVAAIVPTVAVARSWMSAAPNVLLLQGWWRNGDVAYGMNGVSWSLSCEAFFYATFPLAVLIFSRLPAVARWASAGLALLVGLAADVLTPGMAVHLPLARYGAFVLGLVAGLALRNGWRPRIHPATGLGVVAAAAALCYLLPKPVPDTVMAVPFLVAILSAAGLDLAGATGVLATRWFVFAGEASFGLYLVHELVIVNLRDHLTGVPWVDAVCIAVAATLAAVALHLSVERPANRLLRGGAGSVALTEPGALPA